MTPGRAALLSTLDRYDTAIGYSLGLLEVQKLVYFLQEAGQPMRLRYTKYHYGPYAESLNHVLQRMEGHFTRGYGDRTRGATLRLNPEAVGEANDFLAADQETIGRIERVARLINGYETPFGLELLS